MVELDHKMVERTEAQEKKKMREIFIVQKEASDNPEVDMVESIREGIKTQLNGDDKRQHNTLKGDVMERRFAELSEDLSKKMKKANDVLIEMIKKMVP